MFCFRNSTRTTNCGGVTYLNINKGAEEWAKVIMEEYLNGECQKKDYNVSSFKSTEVMNIYRKLYGGVI